MTYPYPRPSLRKYLGQTLRLLCLVGILLWAWSGSDFNVTKLIAGLPRMGEFFSRMLPPDSSVAQTVIQATSETVQIALCGTFLSAVISLPLGMLAASNLSPRWLHQPVKSGLSLLRGIPLILLALLFVSTVGLGAFPGVLAITVHSTGMLGKFYAEAFESAQSGPLEAFDSVGSTRLQQVRFGVLPQVAPDLVRDTLFRFELNLRESLILGLVGAGGIGLYIQLYARAFQYEKVATLTLVVLVMVWVVEQLTILVRKHFGIH